jgi:hypothetical protein
MHGLIVDELQRYVEARLGAPAWGSICEMTDLPRVVSIAEDYPDAQFVEAVLLAASRSRTPVADLLFDFGASLVPPLLTVYGAFVQPDWGLLDVLQHTEASMHRAVRLRDRNATPPTLSVERVGPAEVKITYGSERRMCSLARGIIAGLAAHFETEVDVTEPTCMHRGDPACTIVVVAR